MAALHILLRQAGVHHAVESSDVISQVFEDAADDTITAAMDLQPYLGLVFRVGVSHDIHVCGAILQDDLIAGDSVEVGPGQWFVEGDMIDLFDLMTRMGELLRQVTVVRQQQHTRGVAIEPADRVDPFRGGRTDQVEYRLPSLRIFGGGDIILGFIQEDIDKVFRDCHFFPATLTRSVGDTFVPGSVMGWPLTVTLPWRMSSAASRRLQMPPWAMYLFNGS